MSGARSIRRLAILVLVLLIAIALIPQLALAAEPGPVVTSISPNSGDNGGNVAVQLSGSGFAPGCLVELARAGSKVQATSVAATAEVINCTVDLTGAATGAWDVTVTNPDGHAGTLAAGFTVTAAPANDTYEPNGAVEQAYGPLAAGTEYTSYISSQDDRDWYRLAVPAGTARLSARLGSIPYGCDYDLALFDAAGSQLATSGNGNDTNEVIELSSPAAGQYFMQVRSWSGYSSDDSYVLSFALAAAPVIGSIAPEAGTPGSTVTISGSGFGKVKDGSNVTFGGVKVANNLFSSWTDTKVVLSVPAGVGGCVPVKIVMGAVQSNALNFKIVPKFDSVSPTSGKVGTVITLSGQGFGTWAAGTTCVYFGKVKATTYSAWGNYVIKVKVPNVSGTVALKVVTAGGTSGTKNFTAKR